MLGHVSPGYGTFGQDSTGYMLDQVRTS